MGNDLKLIKLTGLETMNKILDINETIEYLKTENNGIAFNQDLGRAVELLEFFRSILVTRLEDVNILF